VSIEAQLSTEEYRTELLSLLGGQEERLTHLVADFTRMVARAEWERGVVDDLDEDGLRTLRRAISDPEFADVERFSAELACAQAELECLRALRARLTHPAAPEPPAEPPTHRDKAVATRPWSAQLIADVLGPRLMHRRVVDYLVRQAARGRHLAEAMSDPYVVNRVRATGRQQLLEDSTLIAAWHRAMSSLGARARTRA
jgi:hypothetical protein